MQNLDKLLEAIRADYVASYGKADDETAKKVRQDMIERFNEGLHIETGNKKYVRVITGHGTVHASVWGFIVNVHNDKQFRYGDILKPASWKAPAKNKARGNVVDGDFSKVKWTGPEYLR